MKEFLITLSAVMTGLGISKLIRAVLIEAYYRRRIRRLAEKNFSSEELK